MTAGLPGTGLGGLFYILGALGMPLRAGARTLAGRHGESRWREAARQAALALGVLAAIWATGWLLGAALSNPASLLAAALAGRHAHPGAMLAVQNVLRWGALVGTTGLLLLVLGGVEVLRLVVPRPDRRAAGPARLATPDEAPAPAPLAGTAEMA
ncbi:MAG TPA: hypothetical protein VFQ38_11285 [Longimicrobiales bacterium]|nr:hypothetical protein [Longimicrobiales bacterium]